MRVWYFPKCPLDLVLLSLLPCSTTELSDPNSPHSFKQYPEEKKNQKKNQNLIFLSLHQLSTSPVISLSFSQNNCSRPLQTRAHQWAHSISYPSLHQHPIRSLPPAPHWPESPLMHTWWGTALICNSTDNFENWKLLGKKHTLRAVPHCGHWNPTWHSTAGL